MSMKNKKGSNRLNNKLMLLIASVRTLLRGLSSRRKIAMEHKKLDDSD